MTRHVMVLALLVLLNGCVGPQFLKVQRYKYNEAIQESTAQQLLLNIVRLRYNDSPMFLNVGDIDARFSLEATSMASGTINENVGADPLNANSATVSASSKFSNNPNIKLSPMQDADFARLLQPMADNEMLALVTRRESPYEYLALVMQSYTYKKKTVDAYRNASEWKNFLERLRSADEKGQRLIERNDEEEELSPRFGVSSIAPKDVIKAKQAGLVFKKMGKDEFVLVGETRGWALKPSLVVPSQEATKPSQEATKPYLRVNEVVSIDEAQQVIKIRFRSIVQMMSFLSHGVVVPSAPENEGKKEQDQPGIPGFKVEHEVHRPSDAFVSVKYRGDWYYITRSDENSKKFFSVLTELFVERAGKPATTPTILPL